MAKRSYCLEDKPFPVSARAMRTLALVADDKDFKVQAASQQVERLRRAGYVRVYGPFVNITDAGRALLAKEQTNGG